MLWRFLQPQFGNVSSSELPGEDPLLSGEYAGAYVLGMQARDVVLRMFQHAMLQAYTHDGIAVNP